MVANWTGRRRRRGRRRGEISLSPPSRSLTWTPLSSSCPGCAPSSSRPLPLSVYGWLPASSSAGCWLLSLYSHARLTPSLGTRHADQCAAFTVSTPSSRVLRRYASSGFADLIVFEVMAGGQIRLGRERQFSHALV
jgi:hypothetical protein